MINTRGGVPKPMPKMVKRGIKEGYDTLDNYRLWVTFLYTLIAQSSRFLLRAVHVS